MTRLTDYHRTMATLAVALLCTTPVVGQTVWASVAPRSHESTGCTDNLLVYNIYVDLQVDFGGGNPQTCGNGRWTAIQKKVTETLNDKFGTTVTNWEGDVGFGPTAFDTSQETSGRRKLLRGQEQGHRRLNTCPTERKIACEADYCHWGCMIAPTTSCGINTVTNFALLREDVKAALESMTGVPCLGNGVEVNLLIEDPTLGTGSVTRGNTGNWDGNWDSLFEMSGNPMLTPVRETNDGTTDNDVVAKELKVHSKVTITFFEGEGALPDTLSIATAEADVKDFFVRGFERDDDFKSVFQGLTMTNMTPEYDFAKKDEFVLVYDAYVSINEDSPLTARDAANVMAKSRFKDLIDELRPEGGELSYTFRVHFRGSAPVHQNRW